MNSRLLIEVSAKFEGTREDQGAQSEESARDLE